MTTSTPPVSSPSPAPIPGTTTSNPARVSAPHAQDSMETREPVNTGYCMSICSTISSILRFVKAKVFKFLNCFWKLIRPSCFPATQLNPIRDPNTSYYVKICNLAVCLLDRSFEPPSLFIPTRSLMNADIRDAFAELPQDLAEAIICKALQCPRPAIFTSDDRITLSIQGHSDYTLFISQQLTAAVHSLKNLYPDAFFSWQRSIIQAYGARESPSTPHETIRALKALMDFDLNVAFDRFNLHSTTTEEEWKVKIREATDMLPEEVKRSLFEKMGNIVQHDGRESFLGNPRSHLAKQAVEATLQAFPNR